jgi:hypothetical protein
MKSPSPVPRDIACKATRPCSSNEPISELDTNQTIKAFA